MEMEIERIKKDENCTKEKESFSPGRLDGKRKEEWRRKIREDSEEQTEISEKRKICKQRKILRQRKKKDLVKEREEEYYKKEIKQKAKSKQQGNQLKR